MSDLSKRTTSPLQVLPPSLSGSEMLYEQVQLPFSPETPPLQNVSIAPDQEQAVFLLSDAARRIAQVEPGERRVPRVSRLAPLHDISSQIRRHSTPLPHPDGGASTEPMLESTSENSPEVDLAHNVPDLWAHWPSEPEESERDRWENEPDPLLARRIPTSVEGETLEKADAHRARKEGFPVAPVAPASPSKSRMRLAFFCLSILALLVLTIDSVLISFTFIHTQQQQAIHASVPGAPTLTLNPNVTNYGGHVTLHLRHFARSAVVALTHDVAVPLRTTRGSERLAVDASGSADIDTVVDANWEPGFHTIVAEDTDTRYTANATLQVAAGPTRPSHLVLNSTQIDFGAALVGGTTIQRFVLNNGGGGSITWAANSDVSWLAITPNQGVFSDVQTITIGCTRSNLAPGDYSGTITFSSNVGAPQKVQVSMTVRPIPANSGPVLAVAPAGLSFSAVDGGSDPSVQSLVISNPGSEPLNWNISSNSALVGGTGQGSYLGSDLARGGGAQARSVPGSFLSPSNSPSGDAGNDGFLGLSDTNVNWVTIDQSSGMVRPHDSTTLNVTIHSSNLLPGTYINTLIFSADKNTVNMPQSVSISLTILPQCGLTLSTGSLSFTAVAGPNNPTGQSFNVAPTASCSNPMTWNASSSANWLTVTPATGQLNANNNATPPTANVNISNLKAGNYSATITVVAGQSTQTLLVSLAVQAKPAATAPIMGVSTLNLNLTTTQGAANPSAQLVTIANTGQSPLLWRTAVNLLATSWLGVYPAGGTIVPGQTGGLTINAITRNLTPGKYTGQVVLTGTDSSGNTAAGGSPQTVTVNLTVLPPCKIGQPSSSSLAFSAVQGGNDPSSQSLMLVASGNCLWPLSWRATVSGSSSSWLKVSPTTGAFAASGQSTTLVVAPTVGGLAAGSYAGQVSLSVTDSSGVLVGSPQVFSVALSVIQPCSLHLLKPGSGSLSFSLIAGATATQSVSLNDAGSCAWPVAWNITSDSGSNGWLTVTTSSASDSGNGGGFGVNISTANLSAGTYKGTITVSAMGSGQANVQGSPLTIPVTLTVNSQPTYSVSGIVNACVDAACSSSSPLGNATVKLQDTNGNVIGQATTSSSGTYTISGVPAGSYTIVVNGTDANNNKYTSSTPLTVSSTVTGLSINALPSS